MKTNRFLELFRASRIPFFLFAIDLLLLPIEPKYWFPDRFALLGVELGTWRNIAVLLLASPYILQKGWRRTLNPVAIGYTVVMLTTIFLATPLPQVTLVQSIKSYAFLLLGPFVLFELKHDQRDIDHFIILLSLAALTNVAVGIVLTIAHIHTIIVREYATHALRLAGAGIPASLALTGFVSMMGGLALYRRSRKFLILAAVNLTLVILTGTRGTTVTSIIVILGFFVNEWRKRGWDKSRQLLIAAGIAVFVGVAIYAPNYPERFKITAKEESFLSSIITVPSDSQELQYFVNTSGRTKTWVFYWGLVKPDLLFGRGIGAGTVADLMSDKVLRVPHDEYLRFLVEGGLFGLIVMLIAYGLQFYNLYQIMKKNYRIFMLVFILMFAALSLIDNLISGQTVALLLWTFFGLFREKELQEETVTAEQPEVQQLQAQPA